MYSYRCIFLRQTFLKYLLVLSILLPVDSTAQKLDSLLTRYSVQKKDTNKIITGFNIADYYQAEGDYETASSYLLEGIRMANELPYVSFRHRVNRAMAYNEYYRNQYEEAISHCLETERYAREMKHNVYTAEIRNLMAGCHIRLGQYNEALEILQELIVFSKKHELHTNLGLALTASAGVHYNKGDFEKTAEFLFQTAETYRFLKDTLLLAQTYRNLSLIYGQIKNYKLAKRYVHESLRIGQKMGDNRRIVDAYGRFGTIYENERNLDSAAYFLHLAIELCEPRFEDDLVEVYGTLGNIYRDKEEYEKATAYFEKTKQLVMKQRDKRMMAILYYNIGEMLVKQGKYKEAFASFSQLLDYAKESGEMEILEKANYGMYQVHVASGDFEEALEAYVLYRNYGDTLRESDMTNRLNELEAQKTQELRDRIHEIEIEQKEELIRKEQEQKRIVVWTALAGTCMLLLFLVILNKRYRVTSRQKKIIEKQQGLLKEKSDEMRDSIAYAKRIQDAYLPHERVFHQLFSNSFLLFQPKDVVSGDFYWFYSHWNKELNDVQERYIAAADCTGHGVPGALMSVICANALNEVVVNRRISNTGLILDETRALVKKSLKSSRDTHQKDGMDISFAKFYRHEGQPWLEWSGANNPLWIIRANMDKPELESEFTLIEVKGDKQPIGYFEHEKSFQSHSFQLEKGDVVYLFSDGFQDQFGGNNNGVGGKKYKVSRLRDVLLEIQSLPMEQQKQRLEVEFLNWKGQIEQTDDVCFIGIKID